MPLNPQQIAVGRCYLMAPDGSIAKVLEIKVPDEDNPKIGVSAIARLSWTSVRYELRSAHGGTNRIEKRKPLDRFASLAEAEIPCE